PLAYLRYKRILRDSRVVAEADIEDRALVGRVLPPLDPGIQPESRCCERDRFEQRPERYLARMTVEVVHAVRARVAPENGHSVACFDCKAPGLRVVAARRPSRQVEHFHQRRHGRAGDLAAARRLATPNWRRAIAMAMRCHGLRFPHGRQIRLSLPRYASNWSETGAA